jgi:hypothetical protein
MLRAAFTSACSAKPQDAQQNRAWSIPVASGQMAALRASL